MVVEDELNTIKMSTGRMILDIMISLIIELGNIVKLNELNTRELAMLIWLLVLFIWMMLDNKVRKALYDVVKASCHIKLIIPAILFLIYTICLVGILFKVHLWGAFLLKDTIVWFVSSGILTVFKSIDRSKEEGYYKRVLLDNFKITVLLQFILNEYTFNIGIELLIVPITVLISCMLIVIDIKKQNIQVKNFIQYINAFIGFSILFFSIKSIYNDIDNFASFKTLLKLLVPTILSIFSIIPAYILAFYCEYEVICIRIGFKQNRSKKLNTFLKLRLLIFSRLSRRRLIEIWKGYSYDLLWAKDIKEIEGIIKKY